MSAVPVAPQRLAAAADAAGISELMRASVLALFPAFYDPRQFASAAVHVAHLDTQLIADGTYFVHTDGDEIVACGGWSRRNKLYTGSGAGDDDNRLLDPETEPARVRAMFVRSDWTRRGLGHVKLLTLGSDDDPELLVLQRNRPGADLKVFAGASGAGFGSPTVYAAGRVPVAGDFNDDGRLDLAVGHGSRTPITILPGTGGGFGAPVPAPASGGDLAAGDLDGDGRDDLYVGTAAQWDPQDLGPPAFLRGSGGLRFDAPVWPHENHGPEFEPEIADLEGDGRLDVIARFYSVMLIRWGLGPQLVPAAGYIDFGAQTIGAPSAPRTLDFTNQSGGPAHDIEAVIEGDDAEFQIDLGTCASATLEVGGTCAVSVRFAPTAVGDRSAGFGLVARDSDLIWGAGLFGEWVAKPVVVPVPGPTATPTPSLTPVATPQFVTLASPDLQPVTRQSLRRQGVRFRQRFPQAGKARWTLEWPARHASSAARGGR